MKFKVRLALWAVLIVVLSLLLTAAALQSGVGYEGTAIVNTEEPGGWGGTVIYYGNVTASLSPFFYPISHIIGNPIVSGSFTRVHVSTQPNVGGFPHLDDVKRDAIMGFVIPEFFRNIPYYLAVALTIVVIIEVIRKKASEQSVRAHCQNSRVQIRSVALWHFREFGSEMNIY